MPSSEGKAIIEGDLKSWGLKLVMRPHLCRSVLRLYLLFGASKKEGTLRFSSGAGADEQVKSVIVDLISHLVERSLAEAYHKDTLRRRSCQGH